MFGSSKVKDEMRGGERVLYALALIEIFSSLLSGRTGVSVVPNGVIKIINLRQVLICCAYHGIFIRYNHHSVMKLLITTDKHCEGGSFHLEVLHGSILLSLQHMHGITFHVIRSYGFDHNYRSDTISLTMSSVHYQSTFLWKLNVENGSLLQFSIKPLEQKPEKHCIGSKML